jgi:hypothetical protein
VLDDDGHAVRLRVNRAEHLLVAQLRHRPLAEPLVAPENLQRVREVMLRQFFPHELTPSRISDDGGDDLADAALEVAVVGDG